MHINEIFENNTTTFSFEFFPPKTPKGFDRLFRTIQDLIPLRPTSVSVTYGAGGSTRDRTCDLVVKIHQETDLTVIPHLTCVGSTRKEIYQILQRYADQGIENIFAVRGDPPGGQANFEPSSNGFHHAIDLVAFIKKHFPHFGIGVAGFPEGHPDTTNRLKEIEYLKQKVDAGADYIITQMFFDNHDFYDFQQRCELAGIEVPIIAGIMPISSRKNLERMAELSAGSRFPARLLKAIERVDSDEFIENVGIHWATGQVLELLDHNVRGIHFYTLNKSNAAQRVYKSLGITNLCQVAV